MIDFNYVALNLEWAYNMRIVMGMVGVLAGVGALHGGLIRIKDVIMMIVVEDILEKVIGIKICLKFGVHLIDFHNFIIKIFVKQAY